MVSTYSKINLPSSTPDLFSRLAVPYITLLSPGALYVYGAAGEKWLPMVGCTRWGNREKT